MQQKFGEKLKLTIKRADVYSSNKSIVDVEEGDFEAEWTRDNSNCEGCQLERTNDGDTKPKTKLEKKNIFLFGCRE